MFYETKKSRVASTLNSTSRSITHDRDDASRINEQVVYRCHDDEGNERLGVDRHSLTCFVDLNFPENDHLYTK